MLPVRMARLSVQTRSTARSDASLRSARLVNPPAQTAIASQYREDRGISESVRRGG